MVAGCQITVHGRAYVAVLALRADRTLVDVVTLPSPRATDEADSLAGLRVRVCDLLRDRHVQRMALWQYEPSHRGAKTTTTRSVLRAEGVVLAAAAEVPVAVTEISANSERRLGKHASNDALAAARASTLIGTWTARAERAVAASTYA